MWESTMQNNDFYHDSFADNFSLQAPEIGMLNLPEYDLPRPITNYQVKEIDEDDPRLDQILPPEVRDVEGKVVIVQTDIPLRANCGLVSPDPLRTTHISPVHLVA
jgi:hypothetical protein